MTIFSICKLCFIQRRDKDALIGKLKNDEGEIAIRLWERKRSMRMYARVKIWSSLKGTSR